MLNRMNQLAIATYLSVTGYVKQLKEDLTNDERGLSGVVVAVLLILVAVLAVVLLWDLLSEWLETLWGTITGEASSGLTKK